MTNFDQKSDSELLRRFCDDGAAAAFDALVQRYAGMVCGVATRVTGRRELAEEAAQNVFARLAHKARSLVGRGGRLAGWLHRAAVFEAKHLLRGERRHERRIQRAGEEQDVAAMTKNADEALRAEIDSALNSLAASDREVIVWHYYAGLSYREIAERCGKSEAAAQKQGRRALEKLGSRLRGAGLTASAAALASFLGAGVSEAVPAGCGLGMGRCGGGGQDQRGVLFWNGGSWQGGGRSGSGRRLALHHHLPGGCLSKGEETNRSHAGGGSQSGRCCRGQRFGKARLHQDGEF